MKKHYRSGIITIIGKPNVGKSTIINELTKTKISIISKKPHTTQNHVIGISNTELCQCVYIDTPGITQNNKLYISAQVFRNTKKILNQSKLILFILEKLNWSQSDECILNIIKNCNVPVLAIINKIDNIKNKNKLLPYISTIKNKFLFQEIIPISGKTGNNIDLLSKIVQKKMPISEPKYPISSTNQNSMYYFVSELIREKFIFYLGDELPYSIRVLVKKITIKKHTKSQINALIIVNNIKHKKIVIGKNGQKIKLCGSLARNDLEKHFQTQLYLYLWVVEKHEQYSCDY